MWSLGCICVELFLGLPLFPGTSEFNQITRIVEMLGMPPTYMLEVGKQATQFFDMYFDDYGRKMYRLKTIEQYSKEHNVQEQPSKKYFNATTLPEIIRSYPLAKKGMKNPDHEKEYANRAAFIDFVTGLLNLNPIERWSPQQARLHPFITGEPLKEPFRPPMSLKNNSVKPPSSPQTQPDAAKKPYGGLPPTPQRSTTRTYQDAAAYNQHLAQQQAYIAQSNAEAYRQANYPTNPYAIQQHEAAQAQAQAQKAQQSTAYASSSRSQGLPTQPPLAGSSTGVYGVRGSASGPIADLGQQSTAAHHYTSGRGRSNTIGQADVPPQLQKLGADLGNYAGQSITPILHREDQAQAWERRINQSGDSTGLSRRVSVNRHDPQLAFLEGQAEMNWPATLPSSRRDKTSTQAYASSSSHNPPPATYPATAYYGAAPAQPGQASFSVVVDGNERLGDRYAAPSSSTGTANMGTQSAAQQQSYQSQARYAPYGASGPSSASMAITSSGGGSSRGQAGAYDNNAFDSFDSGGDDYASLLYQPLQPSRGAPPSSATASSSRRPSDGSGSGVPYYGQGQSGSSALPYGTSGGAAGMAGVGTRGVQGGAQQQLRERSSGDLWNGR